MFRSYLCLLALIVCGNVYSQSVLQQLSEDDYVGLGSEIVIHPNGKYLYSYTGTDYQYLVFTINPENGELTYKLTINCEGYVNSISPLSDGQNIIIETYSDDMITTMTTYELDENGIPQVANQNEIAKSERANMVAVHPNGKFIFTVAAEKLTTRGPGKLRAYSRDQGGELSLSQELELPEGFINLMSFGSKFKLSPDGQNLYLYSGSHGIVLIYELSEDGQLVYKTNSRLISEDKDAELSGFLFDPSGNFVYICHADALGVYKRTKNGGLRLIENIEYSCYAASMNPVGTELTILREDDDFFQFIGTFKIDGLGGLTLESEVELGDHLSISDVYHSGIDKSLYFADSEGVLTMKME